MSSANAKMNPFPGLRPFTQEEDYLFFGREEQTLELLQRLGSNRFVAVVGTSGSGKSSLVRCGLLSELLGGRMLGAGSSWEIAVTHPGGNPLALLTDSLLEADLYDREEEHVRENLLATLSRSHFGLVEAVKQADLGEGTNFLLVVDQFEEIFRFQDAGQRQQEVANEFISLLLEAVAQKEVPIYVVLTMRSDFIGECGHFEGLAEMVNRGEFLIPRLTREQYKRVIEGPIKVAGGQIAPRLLQRLLNDLGQQADQLPCLQHALMRTWDVWAQRRKDEVGRMKDETAPSSLDLDDYQWVGRMAEALSLHADEIYESLGSDRQRELCKGLFQALTVEESNNRGIRRPQRLGRLCQILEVPAEELVPIIDAYRHRGVTFLMPSPDVELTDQTIIDISHESLMRVWTRLRQWVEEETQAVGIYQRLSESADLHERGKAGLYRDPELGIALAWQESKHPNAAWAERYRPGFAAAMAFLESSLEAAEREEKYREAGRQRELERARQLAETQVKVARLFKRFAGGLAVGLCLAVGLTVWAFLLRQEAKRQEAAANFYAIEATTQAKKAETEARSARKAEQEAKERTKAEAVAKVLAQQETRRAEAETKRAEEQLARAEWLVYAGKLLVAQNDFEVGSGMSVLRYLDECKAELRGWEHRYLLTRTNAKQTLGGHPAAVTAVAFSPDGQRIVTGSHNLVRVWDAATGREVFKLEGHTGPLCGAAYSPDGQRIVTGSEDGSAKVWDAANGRELLSLKGHTGPVRGVAYSPGGQRIVTGSEDKTVKVWDAEAGKELISLTGHSEKVFAVAFSPDSKRIVSGSGIWHAANSEVKVWNAETGQELLDLKGHPGGVTSVAFSPDGQSLVTGGEDRAAKVWNAESGQELLVLKGHTEPVTSVAFSPDGQRIVTGSQDNSAKIWDSRTGQELLALKGHKGQVLSVAFSPDGQRIVSGSKDMTAKVWDAENGQEVPSLRGHLDFVSNIAFSPDAKRIATASGDNTARVWDAETGRELLVLKMHPTAPNKNWSLAAAWSVAFSPDGQRIVTGSQDQTAKVWDSETGQELFALTGHQAAVLSAAFSPDGKCIVTGACDWFAPGPGEAKVWSAENGQELLTLLGHTSGVRSVAFSPDGKRIVTGSTDKTAKVWYLETGQECLSLQGHTNWVNSVAFSPDGLRIVTGGNDHTAKTWDSATGQELLTLKGHTGPLRGAAYSPDGRRIVTGSDDKTAKVWEAETGLELLSLKGHIREVWSVAFSPDNQRVVTGMAWGGPKLGGVAKVWYAEQGQELENSSWPLPDVAERKRYHTEQTALAEQGNHLFAAEFNLRRMLRDDPENAALKMRLATILYAIPMNIAYDQKKFAFAARLGAEAMASDLQLGDDRQSQLRYNAARAAVMAAAGQGSKDEPPLDDTAKTKLRLQALDWLKAELTALNQIPESEWPQVRPWDWKNEADLNSVRDTAALALLPAAEQEQWQAFWTEAETLSTFGRHFEQGLALSGQGKLDEAITEYRAAIRRKPDFAEAYCNLGNSLEKQGDYAAALDMLRKGHELGSQRPDWKYPSAQWVARAERALPLSKRLPSILRGEDTPVDNTESLDFAMLAYNQKKFAAATRLWAEVLASDPTLQDDRQTQHGYNAACAAALADADQSVDEQPLDDAAKTVLRAQALDWLKAELTIWNKMLHSGPPQDRQFIVQTLSHWQKDTDLAGIRDAAELAKLPAEEQKAFTQLWADVAALLKRAEEKPKEQ